jgi:hypothetical protein
MGNAALIEIIGDHEKELARALDQLKMLQKWTSDGEPPTLDQKNQLNFGQVASKYLDDADQDLAQRIYEIRRFIRYWSAPP